MGVPNREGGLERGVDRIPSSDDPRLRARNREAVESLRRQLGIASDPMGSKKLRSMRADREADLNTPADSPGSVSLDISSTSDKPIT